MLALNRVMKLRNYYQPYRQPIYSEKKQIAELEFDLDLQYELDLDEAEQNVKKVQCVGIQTKSRKRIWTGKRSLSKSKRRSK